MMRDPTPRRFLALLAMWLVTSIAMGTLIILIVSP
jgi:hypothetical protein